MITANDLWLRGQTAQRQFMHIANYNSAFLSTAMVQVAQMGVNAPRAFWSAMARAGASSSVTEGKPVAKAATPAVKPSTIVDATPSKPKAAKPAKAAKGQAAPKLAAMSALEQVAEHPSGPRAEAPVKAAPTATKAAPEAATAVAKPAPEPAKAAPAKAAEGPVPASPNRAAKAPANGSAKTAAAAPKPAAAAPAKPDDLTVLSGVGAKLAGALKAQGITTYREIAALDDDGIERIEAKQKGFRMLCARYDVVGQAKAMS